MFGLPELSRSITNLAKAAELQTTKLVIESAKDVADYASKNKVTVDDIKAASELSSLLNDL